ncbi:class I SAM-dependent rRNA methyltransferase [Paenibacillus koleovorans]|uniref:class I SAM-dependent rRNA methyltransferase n=1 Tax=Paenibacillus koleovorans TaxID=121608 RepID=UPI000FDCD02C|nr:class I SAM-dependent rRNA methyltransferase [Paenibacillus koleovorans]
MASVVLDRKRKKRLEQGHPWIFQNEVERIEGEYEAGDLVNVATHQGQVLATGYINPASQIVVRIVSYTSLESMDRAFFVERLQRCLEHRERFVEGTNAYRLVFGEADFLPGLVVDRYADVLVVQILSLGMDRRREEIVGALIDVLQPAGIYERSDVPVRKLEGLELRTGVLYGDCPRYVRIMENGLELEVDIVEGQKTGYFFDQRENRASLSKLMLGWGKRSGVELREVETEPEAGSRAAVRKAPFNTNGKEVTFPYWDGATVLECFSHTGSFTLHACKYGAKKVTCLDISEHAIDSARRNVQLNGFEDRVEFVVADAFDYLRQQVSGLEERKSRGAGEQTKKVDTSKPIGKQGRTWDVVILDPPAFAKTKGAVEAACRGYKEINLSAMKLVNEGGYLVTASCSYHVRPELFLETIQAAAADANKTVRLIEFKGAGKDHPHILGVDEGDYLKFAILQVHARL